MRHLEFKFKWDIVSMSQATPSTVDQPAVCHWSGFVRKWSRNVAIIFDNHYFSDLFCDIILFPFFSEMLSPNSLVKRQSYRSEHVVDMLCIDDSDSEDAISVGKTDPLAHSSPCLPLFLPPLPPPLPLSPPLPPLTCYVLTTVTANTPLVRIRKHLKNNVSIHLQL